MEDQDIYFSLDTVSYLVPEKGIHAQHHVLNADKKLERIVNLCITTNVQLYRDPTGFTGLMKRSGQYADANSLFRHAKMALLNPLSLWLISGHPVIWSIS